MIDMERIETAYNRFRALYNALHFRAQELPKDRDNSTPPGWQVRNYLPNSVLTVKTEEEAKQLVENINAANAPLLEKEFGRLQDELDSSND